MTKERYNELYQITFAGKTLEGFSNTEVRDNVKALFRISDERTARLFSGTRTTLKSGLSHNDALVYHRRLTKAGAEVQISVQPRTATVAPQAEASTPPPAPPADRQTQPGPMGSQQETPLEFTGSGREYFGIWIVNILLTIVTLGIYSAWATVRNNQYFYGNTRMDGASFQYLASPVTILKGRLIALAVLVAYVVLSEMYVEAAVVFAIAFIPLVPWIMVRSLRFKAVNSAYRNIRFDFQGRYGEAFMVAFVWPVLNVLTLLLLTPLVMKKTHEFIANGSRYGTTEFQLKADTGDYYRFFGKGLLIAIGFGVAAFLAMRHVGFTVGSIIAAIGYLTLFGYFMAGIANLFLGSVHLASHGFESRLQPLQMIWIYLSNSFLVVITLGLFTPWAKVRMARYRADCTAMLVRGDLNHFVAAEQNRTSALGQELGDAFDVDFAAI
ncbi:YjgN family protein [Marinobacter sp. TBZ242]|uniref:YjgN family protein n=1 Tax=Marinobacter azerbaijanicus TaxID=3050455 RepID=A0ABT7IDF9_9GAMM|nr:YjgN family protein [Marinobacter sp. TBZ242]MDL0431174.1 YjgN family protein [Marinobacter sp. TBZ242]